MNFKQIAKYDSLCTLLNTLISLIDKCNYEIDNGFHVKYSIVARSTYINELNKVYKRVKKFNSRYIHSILLDIENGTLFNELKNNKLIK